MAEDLSFNFSSVLDNGKANSTSTKGGRWTARVSKKQKAKRLAKPQIVKSATVALVEEPLRSETAVKPIIKRTIISSLFTSLPHIEPQPSTLKISLQDQTPSNAPSNADFATLGIMPELIKALRGTKFNLEKPTAVQKLAIPKLLSCQNDTILQAQTGSGKTIAYLLPIIQDLLGKGKGKQLDRLVGTMAIVLVPTRELAQQVHQVAVNLLNFEGAPEGAHLWLVPGVLSGGMSRQHEKARLRKGVPLLVATPGRLIDHLEGTKSFKLAGEPRRKPKRCKNTHQDEFDVEDEPFEADRNEEMSSDEEFGDKSRTYRSSPLSAGPTFRWLVLDEADRLMDMGFEPQIRKIIAQLEQRLKNSKRRSVLCSATMQGNVQKLAGYALRDPELIKHDEEMAASQFVRHAPPAQLVQQYVVAPEKLRFVALLALLRLQLKDQSKVVIFVSSTASVDFHWHALAGLSMERDTSSAPLSINELDVVCVLFPKASVYRLHGNLDLPTRLRTLKHFTTSKNASVLFCTSVASRGLDIPGVTTVIQYDLPTEGGVLEYVHRVGRTARAGQQGESYAFLLPSETGYVRWLESKMGEGGEVMNKLKEVPVESLLKKGFGGQDYETRSTDVQMALERWAEQEDNIELARTAFISQVRAYATHPAEEKTMFHVKNIHLGHFAKSLGLREAPADLGKLVGKNKSVLPAASPTKRTREQNSDSEVEDLKQVKQPRTGRALAGKGLRPARLDKSEFNII